MSDSADKQDPEFTKRFLERALPNEALRNKVLGLLGELIREANEIGRSTWEVTQLPDGISFNVGKCLALRIYPKASVWVTFEERALDRDDAAALEKASTFRHTFPAVPGSMGFTVPAEVLVAMWPRVHGAVVALMKRAADRVSKSPWLKHHSPGVLDHISDVTGVPLPEPILTGTTKGIPVWLVHTGGGGEAEELFQNEAVVALGFNPMGDVSGVPVTRDAFRLHAARAFGREPSSSMHAPLFRFVHEMQDFDLVISPLKRKRAVLVGRVIGPYRFVAGENFYPQRRPVEWLAEIERDRLSEKAQNEISAQLPFFAVKRHADVFRQAAEGASPLAADGGEAETTATDALNAVVGWPGAVTTYADEVRRTLAYLRERSPTDAEMVAWIQKEYSVQPIRGGFCSRLLRHVGFVEVGPDDHLRLTELGTRYVDGEGGRLLFERMRLAYTGFDEMLRFFDRNPGASAPALAEHLTTVHGFTWKKVAQPRFRAYWGAGTGILDLDDGGFTLTDLGKEVLAALPAEEAPDEDLEEVDDDDDGFDPFVSATSAIAFEPEGLKARLGEGFLLPDGVAERCCAALNAGKHLLLVGPPGTGKSTLGVRLAAQAQRNGWCAEPLTATASADWTTYDTIGGWAQQENGTLGFREGVVTQALRERRWLVLDEVNRADIDKCFGELFTVLAGGTATTNYSRNDKPVVIGPGQRPYDFGSWFRLIATMNVRDKSSLFRLSYAFLRRFAVITVPKLDDAGLGRLATAHASRLGVTDAITELAVRALSSANGLGAYAPLGPSLLLDVLQYASKRGTAGAVRAVGEGVELLVFPQLEGLGEPEAEEMDERIQRLFGAEGSLAQELRTSFQASFPHVFARRA